MEYISNLEPGMRQACSGRNDESGLTCSQEEVQIPGRSPTHWWARPERKKEEERRGKEISYIFSTYCHDPWPWMG